ncbi:hypothetical protein DEJ50_33630 [Streptomyces venezuelae]|uniref:Uncharacterized protein n=1 Tax=Streptomyces venezuelae TaxID=54571 RepID=A0A5P2DA43_STRVZ|nr:hypothetical protein [Streptomyces venezuelae]QES52024.1 hypothetical protein DEJ50_33630 [Streptomyces venezuelae]
MTSSPYTASDARESGLTPALRGRASRAACTLVAGDVVAVDDQVHVVERTVALFGPPASPYITLHFTDGVRHRVPAGWRLPVDRHD